MITRKSLIGFAAAVIVAAGLGAFAVASQGTQRADCPGEIVCPLTGEFVCRDGCPLGGEARPIDDEPLPACCLAWK